MDIFCVANRIMIMKTAIKVPMALILFTSAAVFLRYESFFFISCTEPASWFRSACLKDDRVTRYTEITCDQVKVQLLKCKTRTLVIIKYNTKFENTQKNLSPSSIIKLINRYNSKPKFDIQFKYVIPIRRKLENLQ